MQDRRYFLFSIVVSDNPVGLRKDQAVGLLRLRIILENEVHTDSLEFFVTLDLNGLLAQFELLLFAFSITASRLASFENKYLIRRLLVLDQISTRDDCEVFVVWTDLHGNNFVRLSGITFKEIELKFVLDYLLERLTIIHFDLFRVGNEENIHRLNIQSQRPLKILIWKIGHEVVSVFSGIDREILLVCLVGDTVSHFSAEHHLVASHEVNHDILKLWRAITNSVEENLLIRNDLDPHVTLDKVYETSDRYLMEHFPWFFVS